MALPFRNDETPEPLAVRAGDDKLALGRYGEALTIFRAVEAGDPLTAPEVVRFRIALCTEGLRRWEEALAVYRELAGRAHQPAVATAAHLGQARVWIGMKRPAEAKALLYPLTLRAADPSLRNQPRQAFLAEARYRLGLILARQVLPSRPPNPFEPAVLAHAATDWTLERALGWSDLGHSDKLGGGRAPGFLKIDLGAGRGEARIHAHLPAGDIAALVERLASEAGLTPRWTRDAREAVEGRTVRLLVDDMPLADVLGALMDPLSLTWSLDGTALTLETEAETEEATLLARRRSLARRALRRAVLAHPAHTLTAAAYLELGNLDFVEDKPANASAWYQRLTSETPGSPVSARGFYNLALTLRRLGQNTPARAAFFRVIDH